MGHRYIDKTNKSYYGLECIFIYDNKKFTFSKMSTVKGGIQDVKIYPDNKQIMSIQGTMPGTGIIYDDKGQSKYQFEC